MQDTSISLHKMMKYKTFRSSYAHAYAIKAKDFPLISEQFMLLQTLSSLNVIPTFAISQL